jgi:hypothetical protein
MAWTYGGTPTTSSRDAVRYLIGDNEAGSTGSTGQPTLSDGEVDYELATYPNTRRAAASAARALAAKYARKPTSKAVGDLSLSWGDRAKSLTDLADTLDSDAALVAVPIAGGISITSKDAVEDDEDRVPPAFTRDWSANGSDVTLHELRGWT